MMAEKARIMVDEDTRMKILQAENPKDIKALGRLVKNFDPKKWDENKVSVVTYGNYHKFCQNEELKAFLRSTENKVLVEASPYDTIWGIGLFFFTLMLFSHKLFIKKTNKISHKPHRMRHPVWITEQTVKQKTADKSQHM